MSNEIGESLYGFFKKKIGANFTPIKNRMIQNNGMYFSEARRFAFFWTEIFDTEQNDKVVGYVLFWHDDTASAHILIDNNNDFCKLIGIVEIQTPTSAQEATEKAGRIFNDFFLNA